MNISRHFLKTTGNFAYILSVAFLIAGLITNLMPVGASLAAPVLPKSGSGAIWTTANDCGDESQDVNHYVTGEQVYINGAGFSPNTTYPWEIKGKPGGASGDPNIVVASGTITTDANGAFCFNAYTIPPDDWGEYQVKVSNKGDNYRVTQLPAASASVSVGSCTWSRETGSLTAVTLTLVGASLTINGNTYTTSTTIYLPPGTYPYTWTAQSGYYGSGSGSVTIGSCVPGEASATIEIGTCSWDEENGSLTAVILTLVGASFTIADETYTASQTIYLPPGTYTYSWEAQPGYIGSGSGEITIGSCAPGEASASIVVGTCNWDEENASLTEVAIALVGASFTINDSTYTASTVIYLPPGTYPYTWEAQSGYIGSGSGELNIGSCEPELALPDLVAELQCYTLEELGFIFVISNEGESGEIGFSTDINTVIASLGVLESDELTEVLIPSSASMLYLYVRNGDAWEEAEAITLNKGEVPVCEDPLELESFCSYVDLSKPFGWTLLNVNPFPVTFTWVYGEESSTEPILLAAESSLTFATSMQAGETMQIFVDGILMAASPGPESCPAFQLLELVGVCSTDPAIAHGWIAYNPNSIEVNAEWKVVGGTLAGLLTIPAESAVGFTTPVSAGDNVALYYSGILQDTAMAATGCLPGGGDEPGGGGEPPAGQPPAGQPPVAIGPAQAFQPPLIPVTGGEVPVIIPVTGVDLNAPAFSGMGFFALSLVCFGFGMVLNGLSRRRIED